MMRGGAMSSAAGLGRVWVWMGGEAQHDCLSYEVGSTPGTVYRLRIGLPAGAGCHLWL